MTIPATVIKVADETWVALALLHREYPERGDFSVKEIEERARSEHMTPELRKGVYVHALLHCVANKVANPGRYRLLYETARTRRRLYRPGDQYHPSREGGRTLPERDDLPEPYRPLLDWYVDWAGSQDIGSGGGDPLLALVGSGAALWRDETPDEYVSRLREGW